MSILIAAGLLLLLATICGLVLGWANDRFHVPIDPRQTRLAAALPGANCGACGYVGCNDYAAALAQQPGIRPDLCPVGGQACTTAVAAILGIEATPTWPMRPIVHCAATSAKRLLRRPYQGEPTCHAANLVNGLQGCTFGCLGLGDCQRACTFDSIHTVEGLARVDYQRCTGCGACAKVCPRNIISMVPFKAERVFAVTCSNRDFGKAVSRVCLVGCIGCKACVKTNPVFVADGDRILVDYQRWSPDLDLHAAMEKCPREVMVTLGKPSPKDLAGAQGKPLPAVVEADFKTTVDKTDWQG